MDINYHKKYIKYINKYISLKIEIENDDIAHMNGGCRHNNRIKKSKSKSKTKMNRENQLTHTAQLTNADYSEHVSDPWFSLIKLGLKSVEGRKNKGRFKDMKVGDIVEWKNADFGNRSVLTKIIEKNVYDTFEKYLLSEGLEKCLPGIDTLEQGLNVYYAFYTKEDEQQYGVAAIVLEII
jgi:ASC-1-like (ASCH) protein